MTNRLKILVCIISAAVQVILAYGGQPPLGVYDDSDYELTSSRVYVGPHVFTDGKLEYSAFPGGYFDPAKAARYYVTDWQGNNAAVVTAGGNIVQQTEYYPYGEPTIEPEGQRYLFGGKEREHAAGRNSYDFGARSLTPYGNWSTVDPFTEKFYPISPYSYCGADPVNYIDPDGKAAPAIAGAIMGAIIGGGIETFSQMWNNGSITSLKSILGAAAQGAIVGGMAGATMGTSLIVSAPTAAAANVAGGIVDREIRGEETTATDVVIDGTIGAASAGVGKLAGWGVKKYTDRLSENVKGKIGETITEVKYNLKGYVSEGKYRQKTGTYTPTGRKARAEYDFNFRNIFTGKHIIRESKFNNSGLTPNQKAAWEKVPYPIEIDRTTSTDIKNWTEMFIITGSGSVR